MLENQAVDVDNVVRIRTSLLIAGGVASLQNQKCEIINAQEHVSLGQQARGIGADPPRKFSFTRKLNFPHLSLVTEIQSHDIQSTSCATTRLHYWKEHFSLPVASWSAFFANRFPLWSKFMKCLRECQRNRNTK